MALAPHSAHPIRKASTPPPRIEAARRRVALARRSLGWTAVASFGALIVLVKTSHPARQSASPGALTTPSSLLSQVQGSGLGGGSISSTSAAPSVSTSSA